MLKLVEQLTQLEPFAALVEHLSVGGDVTAGGLWGSSFAPILVGLARRTNRRLMLVCSSVEEWEGAVEDLATCEALTTLSFPAWEDFPLRSEASLDSEILGNRLSVLRQLTGNETENSPTACIIVVPIQALLQPVVSPQALSENTLVLRCGEQFGPEEITAWLTDREFEAVETIETPGQFSRRGGIMDVFGLGQPESFRIEFFGDQVESIRSIDPETQLSRRQTDSCRVVALCAETVGSSENSPEGVNLLDYLSSEDVLVFKEPVDIQQRAKQYLDAIGRREGTYTYEGMFQSSARFRRLFVTSLSERHSERAVFFEVRMLPEFPTGLEKIAKRFAELLSASDRVVVVCNNQAEADRLSELLSSQEVTDLSGLAVRFGRINRGFIVEQLELAVVGHQEIFHRYAVRRPTRKLFKGKGRTLEAFLELSRGDLIVHTTHGIGRYLGTEILEKEDGQEECLTVEFANRVKVYVPASQIEMVQKYVGGFDRAAKLSTLGSSAWEKKKARIAEAVMELAREMLRIQAVRQTQPGINFPNDDLFQNEFEAEFPYQETEDQLQTLDEIKRDMSSPRPMDRLICGDVGYGKTELAMRGAFKSAMTGYQVCVLVPTTVLAQQHHTTFTERMADYPLVIEMLSRFKSRAEQRDILERLAAGQVDIVIGTHRLVQKDVKFASLGLVIIDEEQRFGVKHKEHFKRLIYQVEVLTLRATPFPRTLHMSLLGIREISTLETPPMDRQAIYTTLCHWDVELIREAILRELARDGQVFFVHNRVHNIDKVARAVQECVSEARVEIAHGQMNEHDLERRMRQFVAGEIDVLVATTIIENGLDIPNANTIFINEAENYGLADLHQLRGRVGRYRHHAYSYFLLGSGRTPSPVASKRLKAIQDYTELGAGFHIAMRDLEIRGTGNILGPEQSGHIATLGYDLYCKLLERAVRELKDEPVREPLPFHIHIGLKGYLPADYVGSEADRLILYRKLLEADELKQLEELGVQLVDRFGPYPDQVRQLLARHELRVLARPHGLTAIVRWEDRLVLTFSDAKKVEPLLKPVEPLVRVLDERTVHLALPPAAARTVEAAMAYLRRLLKGALKK